MNLAKFLNKSEENLPSLKSVNKAVLKKAVLWGAIPVFVLVAVWIAVPFTAGNLLAGALSDTDTSFRTVASVGLWVIWGATLLALAVRRPVCLAFLRVWMPAGFVATIWAWGVGEFSAIEASVGIGIVAVAAVISLLPQVGQAYIAGGFGADGLNAIERRLCLRPPLLIALLLVPVTWALVVAGTTSGPLLLANRQWLWGAILTAVGIPIAISSFFSLLTLTRRWLVFVPAGIVLHDPLSLGDEAILLPKENIQELKVIAGSVRRQEAAGTGKGKDIASNAATPDFTDLCVGTLGATLEITLNSPARVPRLRKSPELATKIRVAPSSVNTIIQEAQTRNIAPRNIGEP